jgi:hypothetical protein
MIFQYDLSRRIFGEVDDRLRVEESLHWQEKMSPGKGQASFFWWRWVMCRGVLTILRP